MGLVFELVKMVCATVTSQTMGGFLSAVSSKG